jgi:hypothetical protein
VWDLITGGSEENCLDYLRRLALAEPVSLCHYSSFIVADHEGKRAAALCGFDPRAGGWEVLADAMKNVQREKGWTQVDEKASADRTQPVWKCTFDTLDGAWVIESVARHDPTQRCSWYMRRRSLQGRDRAHLCPRIDLSV